MNFAHPLWLAGALVGTALTAVGYLLAQRRTRRRVLRFANLEVLDRVAPPRIPRWRHLPVLVLVAGLVGLSIAVGGPTDEVKVPRNRATLILAVDVSLSMKATDVAPNRLTAAKNAAQTFIDDLTPGVNLGIISFAGIATVLVQPTTDRSPAKAAIDNLRLDERTASGEAVFTALSSIEIFSHVVAAAGESIPARIVLMTDGKRTTGRTEQDAAEAAKKARVPVDVISFGTDRGLIVADGTSIAVPPDTENMRLLATSTGGQFFRAANQQDLDKIYSGLSEQIGYETRRQDASRPYLIGGFILSVLGLVGALAVNGRIP